MNEHVSSLFRKPPKFIPTPGGCCHKRVFSGVLDLLRKYKWRVILSHRERPPSRFVSVSSAHPPPELVPVHVTRKCQLVFNAVSSFLRKCEHCYPPDNLSCHERFELERLICEDSLVISPADKGGKWMILPKENYDNEAYRQLSNDAFYRPIDNSTADFTRGRLNNLLCFLYRSRFLSLRELRALRPPSEPASRHFYMLPKLHKTVWPDALMPPGRPIISDTGSVSRRCADFVEHFLSPLARLSRSYVRDSLHVISIVQDFVLPRDAIFFTMDVASLYTNIPTEEGIAAVSRSFKEHSDPRRPDLSVLSILRLLLYTNDFVFRGERFLQVNGTAMGCAFGASYANIFLNAWEEKFFKCQRAPLLWLRFIDDIFGVWTHGAESLTAFHDLVNATHPRIQVTLTSSPTSIRFLDLELYRLHDRISYRVGFKATDSFRLLPFDSFHPPSVFDSVTYARITMFTGGALAVLLFRILIALKRLFFRIGATKGTLVVDCATS